MMMGASPFGDRRPQVSAVFDRQVNSSGAM
jgi:hypothetical protein